MWRKHGRFPKVRQVFTAFIGFALIVIVATMVVRDKDAEFESPLKGYALWGGSHTLGVNKYRYYNFKGSPRVFERLIDMELQERGFYPGGQSSNGIIWAKSGYWLIASRGLQNVVYEPDGTFDVREVPNTKGDWLNLVIIKTPRSSPWNQFLRRIWPW